VKKFVSTVVFIFCLADSAYSQNFNRAIYKVTLNDEENFENKLSFEQRTVVKDASLVLDNLSAELIFNDTISIYKLQDGIRTNTVAERIAISKLQGEKPIYTDLKKGRSLQNNTNGFLYKPDEFLIYNDLDFNWQITNERKEIDGINLIKAIGRFYNGDNYTQIIAYFAPSYPFRFGPLGVANLPGLIFELQNGNKQYSLKSIELGIKDIEIVFPIKGTLIETKDFWKELKERLDSLERTNK
jgi:GLPGLI family protein